MLNFQNLSILDKHIDFLHSKIKDDHALFLVGGCVRDVLLGLEKNPKDIDLTISGLPQNIYNNINFDGLSRFITEKYGTITLIPKDKSKYNYEITPLRTEGNYSDSRHPDKIHRSDKILDDAKRRDFSINCIYYTNSTHATLKINEKIKQEKTPDQEAFLVLLKKQGFVFLIEQNLLILQQHNYIEKLFFEGKIDEKYLSYLWNTSTRIFGQKWGEEDTLRVIVDPYFGIQDLLNPQIKAVGNPDNRFQEDALRIIRALRFVSVLNQKLKDKNKKNKTSLFDIENKTWTSLKENALLIRNIAKERIKDEITKVFKDGNPFAFVSLLDEVKLLEILFPSLYKNKYSEQPNRYHPFDTYTHTLLTLYELQKISKNYLVRLAMLYHDTGKHEQYIAYDKAAGPEERRDVLASDVNHRKSSPKMCKDDFKLLGFSKKEIDEIMRYIAEHHTPGEILDAKDDNKVKKLRKLLSENGFTRVNNLLDIAIADRLGQYNPMQNSADISDVEDLRKLLKKLKKEEGQFTTKDLAIDGGMIMQYFNIPAGPQIGKLIKNAMDWVMNDIKERNNKEEILKYLSGCL